MLFETVEVENARYSFPIMVAIHVKPGMNELECYDSIEFSPFEVGFPKYGVSMKTEDFHCRFYAGKVISQHPEPPLKHFQSVFGSAHTIDIKTLIQDMIAYCLTMNMVPLTLAAILVISHGYLSITSAILSHRS